MKFRRSVKSEKHDSGRPAHGSIPAKDAIAIEPPKKVIKALYDWDGRKEQSYYLSFSAGDFLHVVSRENDTEWYEACNPLKNERGLVPVRYFEDVGKTVRDSGGSHRSASATHDSGYAEGGTASSRSHSGNTNGVHLEPTGHRSSKSVSRGASGIYGVVSYDFHAERPDELDAKEGEAIVVIAQSNPEWFVAKPITRLGGPGLIPVAFIELRDMATGQAVADPLEAVQKAGIPKVEEWKKMAAEYKNTSIPLGMVSSSQQLQSMQQSMDRVSLNSGQSNGYSHERQGSNFTFRQQQQQHLFAPVYASVPRYTFTEDKFHFIVECRMSNGTHWDLSRVYEDFYQLQINLINAFPDEAGQVPGKPRILPYMPGPVQFVTDNISEGRRANLDDYLRDLLRLQPHITASSLVRNFFAPRPSDYEVDPNAVDQDEHGRPIHQPLDDRYSQTSYGSHPNGNGAGSSYQQQQQGQLSGQQPAHQYNASQASTNGYGHQRQQQSVASNHTGSQQQQRGHFRTPSDNPPPQQQSHLPGQAISPPPLLNGAPTFSSTAQVKVKAWFDRDTCVVLRMPPRGQFSYDQLFRKIVERRRLEYKSHPSQQQQQQPPDSNNDPPDPLLDIEYRDEKDGEYYRLEGDEDMEIALERNEKLTLAVRAASGGGGGGDGFDGKGMPSGVNGHVSNGVDGQDVR